MYAQFAGHIKVFKLLKLIRSTMLSKKTKHNSRIILIQKLFEQDFFTTEIDKDFVNSYSEESLKAFSGIKELDKDYIFQILEGIKTKFFGHGREKFEKFWIGHKKIFCL